MNNKIKFDFTDAEKSIINKSLNLLRIDLSIQEKSLSIIDEILIKVNKNRVELDDMDSKIVINSLNKLKKNLKIDGNPVNEVNNIILKIINEIDKSSSFFRKAYER